MEVDMSFTPAKDYDNLLKQAWALYRLKESKEEQFSYWSEKYYTVSESRLEELNENLESELEMNNVLTNELEAARERVEELEKICAEAYQVMGILADEAGRFGDEDVDAALTALADQKYTVELLPFESKVNGG